MKAILYKVTISEGVIAQIHGMYSSINEIYIPKYKLFFNHEGIWKYHNGRYKDAEKIKTIKIDDTVAKNLSLSLAEKLESQKIANMILKRAKNE